MNQTADDVADQDACRGERDEHPETRVARAVRIGREHDLRHVDARVGEGRPAPDEEDRRQVPVVADERQAGAYLAPVRPTDPGRDLRLEPAADPDEQQGRDEEADGVDRVDRARAEHRDADPRENRSHQGRDILGTLHERIRGNERVLADEVRDRRIAARAEERSREAGQRRDGTDAGGRVNERERSERGRAAEIGEDHHPLSRPAVDQRSHGDAEDHARQELAERAGC